MEEVDQFVPSIEYTHLNTWPLFPDKIILLELVSLHTLLFPDNTPAIVGKEVTTSNEAFRSAQLFFV